MKKIIIALFVGVLFFAGFDLGQGGERDYDFTVIEAKNKRAIVLNNGNWWRFARSLDDSSALIYLGGYLEGMNGQYALMKGEGMKGAINNFRLVDELDYFYENPSYRIIPIVFVIANYIANNNKVSDEFAEQFIRTHNMKYVVNKGD